MTEECVESLANAIVMQAVKDYREVLQVLKQYPRYEKAHHFQQWTDHGNRN